MSQENKTEQRFSAADLVGVLDCSGSMDVMGPEPPQAWNLFVKKQQEVGGDESHISFYTFNNYVKEEYKNVLLKDVAPYTGYSAKGATSLYDAFRLAVKNQMATGRTENVVLVIITDGMDNSSRGPDNKAFKTAKEEFTATVKDLEDKHNWQVVYLAADQDAFQVGQGYGMKGRKCAGFSKCRGGLCTAVAQSSAPIALYRTTSQKCFRPPELALRQATQPVTKKEEEDSDNSFPLFMPRLAYCSSQPCRPTRQ